MHDAAAMGMIQRVGHLPSAMERFDQWKRPFFSLSESDSPAMYSITR
jgi:hypothetical protein